MTLILGSAPAQSFQQSPAEAARISYGQWLSPKPESKDDISPSPTLGVSRDAKIDWSDPRIQAWNSVEREENGEYIDEAFEVQKNFAAISVSPPALPPPGPNERTWRTRASSSARGPTSRRLISA